MKKIFLICLGLLFAISARAEQYEVTFSARFFFIKGGKIASSVQTKAALLALAAETGIGLSVRDLVLIYDTDADIIAVVKRSDGSIVSTEFQFTDGLTLTSSTGTSKERQALVSVQGSSVIGGSATGRITRIQNTDGSLKTFQWRATFQYGQPGVPILQIPDTVVTGSFSMGKKFVHP